MKNLEKIILVKSFILIAVAFFTINVNGQCSITTQPQDQTICNGDDATFTVAASSSGTLSYQWQQVCSPTFTNYTQADVGISGGFIYDVYVDGNNIYLGADNGLSISTNNGATWTSYTSADGLGNSKIDGLIVSGGVIYATSLNGGGISTSSDGGATWSTITTADGIGDDALSDVEVVGGNIYVSGTNGTLSVSLDGGATWTIYNSSNGLSGNLRDVEIVGGNIYVASNTGLFISMDGGTTFTQYTGFPSDNLESVFVSPSGNIYVSSAGGGFSVSNDGGATWQNYGTADGLPSNGIRDVYEANGVLYAATAGGLAVSYDGGATWDSYDFLDGFSGNTVIYIYEANGLIYAATDGGLGIVDFNQTDITSATSASYTFTPTLPQDTTCSYRVIVSDDNGCSVSSDLVSLTVNGTPDIATITAQSNNCPNETAFDLSTLTVTDNNSVTGTTTTFHTTAPSSATDMSNQLTGAGLMISSSQTVFVMVANTSTGCFDVESFMVNITNCCNLSIDTPPTNQTICNGDDATFTVAASSSGTLSYQWQQVCPPTFTNYTQADDGIIGGAIFDVYVDGNNIYIGGNNGLSISNDNGATWTNYTSADGLGDNRIDGIVESGGVIYAATTGGLSISSDGGANWTNLTTADGLGDNSLDDVEVVGGNIYVSGVSGTISVSSDGGSTWTIYNSSNGLNGLLRDVEIVGGNIYVASSTGLFISMDGGTTFTQYTGFPSDDLESVFVSPSGTIYVSSFSGGFSVSNDGGVTWQDFSTVDGLPSNIVYDVIESSGVIYAAVGGGLAVSYSGGSTWETYGSTSGFLGTVAYYIYEANGLMYVSTDGGLSVIDFNRTDITGANAASYTFTPTLPQDTTCSYRVIVSDDNGCSVSSDLVSLTVNGTPDIATITAQSNNCPNETAFDLNTLTLTDNNSVTGTTTTFHTAAPSSATDMTNQITGAGLMISSDQTVFVMIANTSTGCFDVDSFMVTITSCCSANIGTWN